MTLRTLKPRSALLALFPHVDYTLLRLRADAQAAQHAPTFEQIRAQGLALITQELDIITAQTWGQVCVDLADEKLNQFANLVSREILTITHRNRRARLYTLFFGEKNLSDFRRPKMGAKHEAIKGWVEQLRQSPHPALRALVPQAEAVLAEAKAALETRTTADTNNRIFRDLGARWQWVEELNGARKALYGQLARLVHQTPGMSSAYAEQFFLKVKSDSGARDEGEGEEEETSAALRARIEEQRAVLASLEARLVEVEAAEAAAKRRAEALAAEKARLAEIDRRRAELDAEHAALRARIEASEAQG